MDEREPKTPQRDPRGHDPSGHDPGDTTPVDPPAQMLHRWLSMIPSLHPMPIKPKRPPIPTGKARTSSTAITNRR
jgi:hypothetical protein